MSFVPMSALHAKAAQAPVAIARFTQSE
jgi:hypothetical protein